MPTPMSLSAIAKNLEVEEKGREGGEGKRREGGRRERMKRDEGKEGGGREGGKEGGRGKTIIAVISPHASPHPPTCLLSVSIRHFLM